MGRHPDISSILHSRGIPICSRIWEPVLWLGIHKCPLLSVFHVRAREMSLALLFKSLLGLPISWGINSIWPHPLPPTHLLLLFLPSQHPRSLLLIPPAHLAPISEPSGMLLPLPTGKPFLSFTSPKEPFTDSLPSVSTHFSLLKH